MRSGVMPQPARPSFHVGRLLLGELVRREAGLLGVALVDPRAEVGRREVGEREAEVGEVALGVDQQAGHAGRQRLLDEHDAEAGLARARHAHDHAVGREVAGSDHRRGAGALVRGRIDQLAEAEVSHAGDCRPGQRDRPGGGAQRSGRPAKQPALPFASMTFRGWPADAFDFYRGLEADNSKAYWQANKHRYEESVKAPFEALLGELDQELRAVPHVPALPRHPLLQGQEPVQDGGRGVERGRAGHGPLRAGVRRRA